MSRLSPLSVEAVDLVNFFGAEPMQQDSTVPGAYNDSAYEAVEAQTHLSFSIALCVKDVRILLTVCRVPVFELNAMGARDVRLHIGKGRDSSEVVLTPRNSIWLYVKPQTSILQSVDGE